MKAARLLRDRLAARNGPFAVLEPVIGAACGGVDPMRVVLRDATGRLGGIELQHLLAEKGCWAEMADDRHVVLVFGPGAAEADADKLAAALDRIAEETAGTGFTLPNADGNRTSAAASSYATEPEGRIGEPCAIPLMPPDEADTETLALEEAADRTAAETVIPYPPGIPLLYTGERISEARIAAIRRLAAAGARFQGAADPGMRNVRVIAHQLRKKETSR